MRFFTKYEHIVTHKFYTPKEWYKDYDYFTPRWVHAGILEAFADYIFWNVILGLKCYDMTTHKRITRDKAESRLFIKCYRKYNWFGRFLFWYYKVDQKNWTNPLYSLIIKYRKWLGN
jgi:hypothetical protein